MSTTEIELPVEYTFGYLVGRMLRAVGNVVGSVDDYPDGLPITMKHAVSFTPNEQQRVSKSTVPSEPSIAIEQDVIWADLDGQGYLTVNNERGVWLYTGSWTVSFDQSLGWKSFPILITADYTLDAPFDLFLAAPYNPPSGITVHTLEVSGSVTDGDVLIVSGNTVVGVNQSLFKGDPGDTPTFAIGEVITGAPGSIVQVTVSGTAPNYELNFTIPAGLTNSLSIGTVTTVPSNQPASAEIVGDPPNQELNLELPAGPAGYSVRGPVRHAYAYPYDYVGNAQQGSLETDPVWTITRIDTTKEPMIRSTINGISWADRANGAY